MGEPSAEHVTFYYLIKGSQQPWELGTTVSLTLYIDEKIEAQGK